MYNVKTETIETEGGYHLYTKIMSVFMTVRPDKRFYAVKLDGEPRPDAVHMFNNTILVIWSVKGQQYFLADSECKGTDRTGGGVSHEGKLVKLSVRAAYNNVDEICDVLPPKLHADFKGTVNAAMMGVV